MQKQSLFCRADAARPTLYLTVGLPGSGKTTRAIELAATHNAIRLSLDAWMIPIFQGVNEDKSRDLLEGLMIWLALQCLQFGTNVVLDFGLWSKNERSALRHLAGLAGANAELIYMPVDRETQFQRVHARYEKAPEKTFAMTHDELDRWREHFEAPDQDELSGTTLDEPPRGVSSWPTWASRRWPSFNVAACNLRAVRQTQLQLQVSRNNVTGIPQGARPRLTLFCGLPGAGKTTLAKQLEAAGRGVRVCADDWQARLEVASSESAFYERLQTQLYECALEMLHHGVDVVLEDGLWTKSERDEKFNDARQSGAEIDLHVFDVPLDVLWQRLQVRNHSGVVGASQMTLDELRWSASLFELPDDDELSNVDTYVVHRELEQRIDSSIKEFGIGPT